MDWVHLPTGSTRRTILGPVQGSFIQGPLLSDVSRNEPETLRPCRHLEVAEDFVETLIDNEVDRGSRNPTLLNYGDDGWFREGRPSTESRKRY